MAIQYSNTRALMLIVVVGGLLFLTLSPTSSSENNTVKKMELQSSHDKTALEKVIKSGTNVQAGIQGNTLHPQPPPPELPPPDSNHMIMDWDKLPPVVNKMFIGCSTVGSYLPLKDEAYFVLIQTPPKKDEIYGEFALFVEGHKIGIKAGSRTVVTEYQFDFHHHLDYTIEAAFSFITDYHSRIELIIDKASTGIYFDIRDTELLKQIRSWPRYVLMNDLVKNAHLCVSNDPQKQWGSIIEKDLN